VKNSLSSNSGSAILAAAPVSLQMETKPPDNSAAAGQESAAGRLIINADDWGRNFDTTERILECTRRKTISSVSAMVFMEDSARAAKIARESGIDAGLHLNLTTPFTDPRCPSELSAQQHRISEYFRRYHPLARVVYHPGLSLAFKSVVAAQIDEFRRIYGTDPTRIDGHHHAHLASNVVFGGLLPAGTIVRRNFSFKPREKSWYNLLFRNLVDHVVARNHRVTDYFFSIDPIDEPGRLQRIFSLAQQSVVEVETHPYVPEEYRFLSGTEILKLTEKFPIASTFAAHPDAIASS
jgi:chitin disaccharide deacetylase